MLGFFSGVDVYSVTITVAAFMAGLGCGSLAGGHLADRLSPRNRLLTFGLAEAIITFFALGSKWLYYDLLYVRWSALADSTLLLPVVLFLSLLIPTFCMGITLPILAKAFTTKIEAAATVVGYLYGVNTLGAAVGALVTPWILLRQFAFPEILQLGAALNAICAFSAVLVWWWSGPERELAPARVAEPKGKPPVEERSFPVRVWMIIYGLSKAGPRGAARPHRHPGSQHASDAPQRRRIRRRPGRRGAGLRKRAGCQRRRWPAVTGLRRPPTGHGRRGSHQLALPGDARGAGEQPTGGRCVRLPQTTATANHIDAARGSAFAGGLAGGSGAGKADAVAAAIGGAEPVDVPAAGAVGREATVWLVDKDAASQALRGPRRPWRPHTPPHNPSPGGPVTADGRPGIVVALTALHACQTTSRLRRFHGCGHNGRHGRQRQQVRCAHWPERIQKLAQAALNADVTVDQVDAILVGFD